MAAAGKVCTGFSKPYVAKYSNAGGVVSYSGCMQLARGVSVSLSLDTTDDNNFYADNIVAETAAAVFTSGMCLKKRKNRKKGQRSCRLAKR